MHLRCKNMTVATLFQDSANIGSSLTACSNVCRASGKLAGRWSCSTPLSMSLLISMFVACLNQMLFRATSALTCTNTDRLLHTAMAIRRSQILDGGLQCPRIASATT